MIKKSALVRKVRLGDSQNTELGLEFENVFLNNFDGYCDLNTWALFLGTQKVIDWKFVLTENLDLFRFQQIRQFSSYGRKTATKIYF